MGRTTVFAGAVAVAGIALAFGLGVAVGQNAPTETRGATVSPPTALPLSGEIEGVEGRQLRMRTVTIAPGGVVAIHSHNGRPAVAYIAQGTLTEHRDSGEVFQHHQGETFTEGKEVTHWAENAGNVPVVVAADAGRETEEGQKSPDKGPDCFHGCPARLLHALPASLGMPPPEQARFYEGELTIRITAPVRRSATSRPAEGRRKDSRSRASGSVDGSAPGRRGRSLRRRPHPRPGSGAPRRPGR